MAGSLVAQMLGLAPTQNHGGPKFTIGQAASPAMEETTTMAEKEGCVARRHSSGEALHEHDVWSKLE